MFEQLTEQYSKEREGFLLSTQELAELVMAAKESRDVHPAVWAKFKVVLTNCAGMKAPAVASTYRECRITSDLGSYPYSVEDFVPAFLQSRGFKMNFGGEFGNDTDAAFILNKKPPPKTVPTANTVIRLIAKLGGFLGRKGDGEPGAKTLWLGMRDIAVFVQGTRYARELELAG